MAKEVRKARLPGRLMLLLAGTELATLGITLTTVSGLGTTPISTVPYVLSQITPLTFGTTTFLLNVLFVIGQILLLRRHFLWHNLLQIPAVLVFGACIDLNMHFLMPHAPESWAAGLAVSLLGNAVLAAGIVCQIRSKTIVQPGEGIVLAAATVLRKPFGNVKIANDLMLVLLAAAISWYFLHAFAGLREGTLVSAVCVGLFVKAIGRMVPEKATQEPHEIALDETSQR